MGLVIGVGIAAFVIGGGAVFGITKASKTTPEPVVIKDDTAEKQQDVIIQLTDLDLVKEACSTAFIVDKEQGDVLCRELFCRMQQRGMDAKTGATECEAISNAANKKMIINFCTDQATFEIPKAIEGSESVDETELSEVISQDALKQCIDLFDRRI